jgi:hypothetical protein
MKTLLNIVLVSLVTVLLCTIAGCQQQGIAEVKASIRDGLIIGHEVEKMERAKGHDKTADKIQIIVDQVQKVVDANDIKGNCPMLEGTADLAYAWVSENYPTTLYPTLIALLQERLSLYCAGEVVK